MLVPMGILVVIFSPLGLRKPLSILIYRLVQIWARVTIFALRCKLTVKGRENIPRKGSVCFVSNHGSIIDIVMLLGFVGRPFGFIAKKELRFVPLVNMWVSVLGGLFIDRKNPRKALKTINAGVARIKAGGSMVIFPEGHRSRGQGLLPFRPGSLKLATQSGAVIVPIALAGTYDVYEKNYRVTTCPVKITFCEPINTADIPYADRKQALSDQIYGIIKRELDT